jgi:hypothetical protein
VTKSLPTVDCRLVCGSAVIKPPQGSSLFGASLAISGNILAVSAPDTPPNGAIYVFQIGAGDKLRQLAVLSTTDGRITGIGDSLVMTDDTIVAGALISARWNATVLHALTWPSAHPPHEQQIPVSADRRE